MDNVLYHHGILGMKWGIRRYQNKDGSLTAEGIKRYRTDLKFKSKYDSYSAKHESKAAEKRKQQELKRVDTLMKKDPRKLTDEELAERIRRLDMEKRVSDLERAASGNSQSSNQQSAHNSINAGKTFIKKTAGSFVDVTTKLAVNYAAKKLMKGIFSDFDDGDKKDGKKQNGGNSDVVSRLMKDSGLESALKDAAGSKEKKQTPNKSVDDGKKVVSDMIDDFKDVKRDWAMSDRTVTVGKDYLDNIWDGIKDTSADWGSVTSSRSNGSDSISIGDYDFTFDRGRSKSKWMV